MALSLDGHATAIATGATLLTPALTATLTNDIIVAAIFLEQLPTGTAPTVSSVSGGGLTWTKRSSKSGLLRASNNPCDLEIWWALSTGIFSGTITITPSVSIDNAACSVFGVNGANTSSPWDANVALPANAEGNTGTANAVTVSGVSTTNANTMLLQFMGGVNSTTETAGSGLTLIDSATEAGGTYAAAIASQYQVVSAAQSGASLSFGTNFDPWFSIADAIQAASGGGGSTPHNRTLMGVGLFEAFGTRASGLFEPVRQLWRPKRRKLIVPGFAG